MHATSEPPREQARIWRIPELPGLELMRATYIRHRFSRHSHEGYAFGVIERGALAFHYRRENVVAPAGTINLANPDEPHDGHGAGDSGWTYRMLYLSPEMIAHAAAQVAGKPADLPYFASGVLHDPVLARAVHDLHRAMSDPHTPRLEKETRLMLALAGLIRRHADAPPRLHPIGSEASPVRRAVAYLKDRLNTDLSVAELAGVARLSPFHFTRVFARETGMPPHAFLIQERARQARGFLDRGLPIAESALAAGFSDQSHLNRHFKRIFGITPGQYSRIVQDRSILSLP